MGNDGCHDVELDGSCLLARISAAWVPSLTCCLLSVVMVWSSSSSNDPWPAQTARVTGCVCNGRKENHGQCSFEDVKLSSPTRLLSQPGEVLV